tara:strand:+ start:1486 stop:1695 length:210 start_codon:yes stop_codon:yes gene_type:complete
MEKEFDSIVKKYLKEGKDIDSIQEAFLKVLNKNDKKPSLKKTKKNRKRICRPVMLISDSSCDEFEIRNN